MEAGGSTELPKNLLGHFLVILVGLEDFGGHDGGIGWRDLSKR